MQCRGEGERAVTGVGDRQLHIELQARQAQAQFGLESMRPKGAGGGVVGQAQHADHHVATGRAFDPLPSPVTHQAVARQGAEQRKLRKDDRDAAAHGLAVPGYGQGGEVEPLLVAGRDPRHQLAAVQHHRGLGAVGCAQPHRRLAQHRGGFDHDRASGSGRQGRNATRAAATVAAMSSAVCAALTKPASYSAGAR